MLGPGLSACSCWGGMFTPAHGGSSALRRSTTQQLSECQGSSWVSGLLAGVRQRIFSPAHFYACTPLALGGQVPNVYGSRLIHFPTWMAGVG